jgi:hypothetical protein
MIFGADYDADGKAIKYHLKDSYLRSGSFTYIADADKMHAKIWELGTIDLR